MKNTYTPNVIRSLITTAFLLLLSLLSYSQCSKYGKIHNEGLSHSTHNSRWDQLFIREKKAIEKYFGIDIRLRFAHHTSESNAWASDDGYKFDNDGTIVFTMEFLKEFDTEFTLAAVFAHEAAHILQYRYNWQFKDSKHDELFCDMMAGIYLNNRNFLLNNLGFLDAKMGSRLSRVIFDAHGNVPFYEIRNALKSMEKFGDYNIGSIHHHGTNEERFHATVAGYLLCANMYNMYQHPWNYPKSKDLYRIVQNLVDNRCLKYRNASPIITDMGYARLPYFEKMLLNHSAEISACEKGIFGELESVYFNDVAIEHNVIKDGKKGMIIHVDFVAYNLKSAKCRLLIMVTQNGAIPIDHTGKGVEESIWFTPRYENSIYSRLEKFIAYSQIPIKDRGIHHLAIEVLAGKGTKPLGYRSRPENFTITNR